MFQVAVSNSFQQVKLEYSTTEEERSQQDKHGSLPDLLSYVFCNLAREEIWDACSDFSTLNVTKNVPKAQHLHPLRFT